MTFKQALFISAGIMFSIAAFHRNIVWMTEKGLWADAVKKASGKARPHTNLGVALKRNMLIKEAEKEFRTAVSIRPDDDDAISNLGDIYRINGRLAYSEKILTSLVRLKPEAPYGHNNLGNVYVDMRRYDEAMREYDAALRLKPFFPDVHNNMAELYRRRGRLHDALKEAIKAVNMMPPDLNYRNTLSLILTDMGRFKEAVDEIKIIQKINPDYPDIYTRMAILYFEMGDTTGAVNAVNKAISINSSDFKSYLTLGNIYRGQNPVMAVKAYEKAVEINPDYAEAHYNLAVSLEEMGRRDEALRHYKRFVETAPQELKELAEKVMTRIEP